MATTTAPLVAWRWGLVATGQAIKLSYTQPTPEAHGAVPHRLSQAQRTGLTVATGYSPHPRAGNHLRQSPDTQHGWCLLQAMCPGEVRRNVAGRNRTNISHA